MIDKTRLSDRAWEFLLPQLCSIQGIRLGEPKDCRQFIDAVLWILRSGCQWRLLPLERGKWNAIFKRFSRWNKLGVWNDILQLLAQQADQQEVSIDSSVIRAHACAAGAAKSDAETEALGRSKGGFSCKIHMAVDGLGFPIKFILTGGQVSDTKQAIPLLEDIKAQACLADKAYDFDVFIAYLESRSIKPVIPPKANRKEPRECDFHQYKERHVVECMFGKLKYYRRIATRYEKMAVNYMGMLSLAAVLVWLC